MLINWRYLALEVMVTLSETASAMVRKHAREYVVVLVHEVLKMMTQIEDEEDWSISDEIVEDDNFRQVHLFPLYKFFNKNYNNLYF